MASSSDTANAVRGFVPPQNDDERRLMRRVEELCRVAVSRGIPRYTGFLSDREQSLAQAACNKAGCSCIRCWERKISAIPELSINVTPEKSRTNSLGSAASIAISTSFRAFRAP